MNTRELIKENNNLREKLNSNNEKYYSDILIYIRSKGLIKSEYETEEILLELLNDLIEAQNKGIEAEEYFGKNSKILADEILNNIDNMSFKELSKGISSIFGIFLVFLLFIELIGTGSSSVDIGNILFALLLMLPIIVLIFNLISSDIYSNKSNKFFYVVFTLIFLTYIVLNVAFRIIFPNTLVLEVAGSYKNIIILVLTILLSLFICIKNYFSKYLLIVIWGLALPTIFYRQLESIQLFNTGIGKIVITLYVIILIFAFFYSNIKNSKK